MPCDYEREGDSQQGQRHLRDAGAMCMAPVCVCAMSISRPLPSPLQSQLLCSRHMICLTEPKRGPSRQPHFISLINEHTSGNNSKKKFLKDLFGSSLVGGFQNSMKVLSDFVFRRDAFGSLSVHFYSRSNDWGRWPPPSRVQSASAEKHTPRPVVLCRAVEAPCSRSNHVTRQSAW